MIPDARPGMVWQTQPARHRNRVVCAAMIVPGLHVMHHQDVAQVV